MVYLYARKYCCVLKIIIDKQLVILIEGVNRTSIVISPICLCLVFYIVIFLLRSVRIVRVTFHRSIQSCFYGCFSPCFWPFFNYTAMFEIMLCGTPFKIFDMIICFILVNMVNLGVIIRVWNKSCTYKSVYSVVKLFAFIRKSECGVSLFG